MTLSEMLAMFPESSRGAVLIGAIIGALFSAFFGFRFFKLSLVVSFGCAGLVFGYSFFDLMLGDLEAEFGFDVAFVIGILCAVILALLAVRIYKASVYLCGGMIGAALGFAIPYAILTALELETVGIIVGIVAAIILAIILGKGFMKMMKPIIIIETSLNGMAIAFEAAAMLLVTNDVIITVASVVGLLVGLLAIKAQVKMNEGRELFEKK